MIELDRGKKIGVKKIKVYVPTTQRNITLERMVFRQKTLAKGHPTYWFQTKRGEWANTTRKGIKDGVVLYPKQLPKKIRIQVSKKRKR